MDQELNNRLSALEQKVDAIHTSVEKTRKYFLWTLIITVAMVVLPIIGLIAVIPTFLGIFSELNSF